ncbi:hypothetical protein QE152_g36727 [Popillia japonica]|uniref:Uncharacterized protein n=1 Tax=Popillia japonica TaxID=7064 RepID=A0AAW1IBZ0_POPJA
MTREGCTHTVAAPGGRLLVTEKPEYLGQVLAALAVSLGPFAAGLGKGYSSPAIASLQQRDANEFLVNGQQASWLASVRDTAHRLSPHYNKGTPTNFSSTVNKLHG